MNMYAESRINAKITQEKAAELLNLSVDSVRAYEKGRSIPSNETVEIMGEVFNDADLYHNHLSIKSNGYIPFLEDESIANIAIKFMLQDKDMEEIKEDFLEIAKDGKVDKDEMHYWDNIKKEAREALELCFAIINFETS